MSAPKFNDPKLAKAWEQSAPVFEEFKQRLDKVSADIRAAESLLAAGGIGFAVMSKRLSWARPVGGGQFRILYGEKPLIECRVAERLDGYKFLPLLMEEVSHVLKKRAGP